MSVFTEETLVQTLVSEESFGIALFSMEDEGPKVLYTDLELHSFLASSLSDEPLGDILEKIAIHTIVLIGQGHVYPEGVFEIPAGKLNIKSVLVSFKLQNLTAKDPRLRLGYFQLAIFLPIPILKLLPSTINYEKELLGLLKSFTTNQNFSSSNFMTLKQEISNVFNFLIGRVY